MIKKLSIKRFKQLSSFESNFDWINILVGSNNSGKSSVLQAIHFFISIAQSRLLVDGWPVSQSAEETKFSSTISPQQIIYTPAQDMMHIALGGELTQNPDKKIEISVELDNAKQGYLGIRKGKNRNISLDLKGYHTIGRFEKIETPFSIYVPGLAGLAKTENYIGYGSLLRSLARGDSNMILRNVLYYLSEDEKKWGSFKKDLFDIFPDTDLTVTSQIRQDEHVEVNYSSEKRSLPIDYAGTGFLQTIQILAYINLFSPVVTLLDEPDSHLHPNNQKALAKKLSELAEEKRTQIILATHSRHIIDALSERATYIWVRDGQAQQTSENIDVLLDLGALDGAEGLLAGGVKFVILTEDKDTKPIKILLSKYIDDDKAKIWSYNGCTKLDTAIALSKFIRDVSKSTRVIIHRDSDYLYDAYKSAMKKKYEKFGLTLFFTKGTDIESYFINVDHLKKLNQGHEAVIDKIASRMLSGNASKWRDDAKKRRLESRKIQSNDGLAVESTKDVREWAELLHFSDARWILGKTYLAEFKKEFHKATKTSLKIFQKTRLLFDEELRDLLSS